MQIKFSAEPTGDAIAYLAHEADKGAELIVAPEGGEAAVKRAIAAGAFRGGVGQVIEILAPEWSDASRVLIVGAGKKSAVNELSWQKAAASLVKRVLTGGAKSLSIVGAPDRTVAANLAFGARLAAYRFDTYRLNLKTEKKPTLTSVSVVSDSAAGARSDYAALSAKAEGNRAGAQSRVRAAERASPGELCAAHPGAVGTRPRDRGAGCGGDDQAGHGLAAGRGSGFGAWLASGRDEVARREGQEVCASRACRQGRDVRHGAAFR